MNDIALAKFKKGLRISALGACPRQHALEALATSITDGGENPRFLDGHWHEFEVKRRLLQTKVVSFENGLATQAVVKLFVGGVVGHITGHLDGTVTIESGQPYLPTGRFLLEVKSMSSGTYWQFSKLGLQEAFPTYWAQIQGYLSSHFIGLEQYTGFPPLRDAYNQLEHTKGGVSPVIASVPDLALIVAKNKDTGAIRTEIIEPDQSVTDFYCARWEQALADFAAGKLPERAHSKGYKWCSPLCWPEEDTETPTVLQVTAQEALEAAEQYTIGSTLVTMGGRLMEEAKPVIEARTDGYGKYQVGPLSVNVYPRKREDWNHRKLESILSADELAAVKQEVIGRVVHIRVPHLEDADLAREAGKLIERISAGSMPEYGSA